MQTYVPRPSVLALAGVTFLAVVAIHAPAKDVVPGNGARNHREHEPPTSDRQPVRLERPSDPPAPKPVPPPEPIKRRTGPVVRGPFTSIQVNVDELGDNIFGDAANEPSIAIDPTDPDKIAIGWRQFDNVSSNFRQAGWGYSQDGGQSWTFPGVLEPGVFRSDPVLASDADGRFYYNSLTITAKGEFLCDVFKSTDGGVTWGPRVPAWGGDKAWMTIDQTDGIGRGNIYCSWSWAAACCGFDLFTRSTDGGQNWMVPIPFPEAPVFGTMTVGPDGELYVGGVDFPTFSNDRFIVVKSANAQDPGVMPVFDSVVQVDMGGALTGSGGPNPGGLLGQAWIATDHSDGPTRGNVYLLCSVDPPGSDPLDVMFSHSTDGGWTWSAPVRVNDDPTNNGAWQWFGTMSVAPNGRIDAVWNDTRNSRNATHSELSYASSHDGGLTWSENVPVSPLFNHSQGYPNQDKLGDYYDMVSDSDGANVAYAATFNGEQDVYFLRVFPDCNGNGVADNVDITAGTSQDCTGNYVPDECEPDCNGNSTADSCDIQAGTSEDCSANGIPDECEPDCNGNTVADSCDIVGGTSEDCDENDVPDECQPFEDCNTNGIFDPCDVSGGPSSDCNGNRIPDECELDCDNNGVPDTCDPPFAPEFLFRNENQNTTPLASPDDGPLAQDVHLGGPASLRRFDVSYQAVASGISPAIVTVRFYNGSADDTVLPEYPGGLLAEYVREEPTERHLFLQSWTHTISEPVPLPQDLWMEVQFDLAPGHAGLGVSRLGLMQKAGPPTVGSSHGLVYDSLGDITFSPVFLDFTVRGFLCADCNSNGILDACDLVCHGDGGVCDHAGCGQSGDCNENRAPDECDPDADGDEAPDDCDNCPNEPALVEPSEPDGEVSCADGIDNDCDGLTDIVDPDCTPSCLCGDLDGDGEVNLSDFVTFARCFGLTAASAQCSAEELFCSDLDGDGEVTLSDFATFSGIFGQPPTGSPPDCP